MPEPTEAEAKGRRRSERLYLTIPIQVFGTDPNGRDFCEDALTVVVSRHGGRIRLENPLVVDDEIHITNLSTNKGARFRVVGCVAPAKGENPFADWGVECLEVEKTIWGVEFKDSPEDAGTPSALLECCACNNVFSVQLSYEEVDTLSGSGLIKRPCTRCRDGTFWKYASTDRRKQEAPPMEKALAAAGIPRPAPSEPPAPPPGPPQGRERRSGEDRRQERRVAVRVPIRIRAPDGSIEITKTENLSKSGARFLSEKHYAAGATLFVAAPYTPGEKPIETKAVVEEIEELPASTGNLYGVKFYAVRFETGARRR